MKNRLNKKVFLIQTDTTVGFLSQDGAMLARLKERDESKPFVQVAASYKTLKRFVRIPKVHKIRVRRTSKTTYVYPNNLAIRIAKDERHAKFLKPFEWFYSTSANERSLSYCKEFAFAKSDIIVEDSKGLYEGEASRIIRLHKRKTERLR